MKSRSLLIFLLILSLAVLPSFQLALAASSSSSSSSSSTTTTSTTSAPKPPYSEKLAVYTAGGFDYWQVTLSPVNASRAGIVAAESVPGVNAYELTAIAGSAAVTGSSLFYPGAYNVIPLPFIPYSGVFLNVTATSQSAASSAASDFGTTLGVNFQLLSSAENNYTFYSTANFNTAGETVFSSVPTSNGGMAAIATESSLAADPTPTAILTGVRNGTSFSHTVSFGSTETGAVSTTNNTLLLEDALSLQNDSFVTSPDATSSHFIVHSLDGLIKSPDNATVTNNVANYSASYSISIPAGTEFRPNVTLLQNPPVLTATRTVSTGSASSGGLISVTLSLDNSADNGTISNVSVNDSWYTAYPSLFSLSAGNSSFTLPSPALAPGQNVSRAYVLKVDSSASEDIIVPAVTVSYSYTFGNVTVNLSTQTNQVEIRTNDPGPSIEVRAGSSITSGSSVGKPGNWVVTVENTGDDPALNLNVMNFSNPTLTPGGVWKVNMSLPLTSIANRNLSQIFNVGWTAPDGSKATILSNPATVVLNHGNLLIPVMQFKLAANLTAQDVSLGSVNASYTLSNKGSTAAPFVSVSQALPAGMTCKSATGNGTCSSSGFSLNASSIAGFAGVNGTVTLTFTHQNFIPPAAILTATVGTLKLQTLGSELPIAAGVGVTKAFAPTAVFQGQDDNVTVRAMNQGSLPVYNLTLTTSADPFDTAVSGSLNQEYPTLASNASQSLNYTVKMISPGNHSSTSTTLSYVFAGVAVQYPVSSGSVLVYKDVEATTYQASTPTEGHDFALDLNVTNPSPVAVTGVSYTLTIPQGITIVSYPAGVQAQGRTLTFSLPSLAPGATTTSTVTLRGDFDGTFNPSAASVTFHYLGATLTGVVTTANILVGVDALLRYELPIGLAVVLTLLVAVYMHRKLAVPQPK
jgi:hypothetical protein